MKGTSILFTILLFMLAGQLPELLRRARALPAESAKPDSRIALNSSNHQHSIHLLQKVPKLTRKRS